MRRPASPSPSATSRCSTASFRTKLDAGVADAVQQTLLATVSTRDRIHDGQRFRAYLLGVARNELLMIYRARPPDPTGRDRRVDGRLRTDREPRAGRSARASAACCRRCATLRPTCKSRSSCTTGRGCPPRRSPRSSGSRRGRSRAACSARANNFASASRPLRRTRRWCAARWPTSRAGPRRCGDETVSPVTLQANPEKKSTCRGNRWRRRAALWSGAQVGAPGSKRDAQGIGTSLGRLTSTSPHRGEAQEGERRDTSRPLGLGAPRRLCRRGGRGARPLLMC